MAEQHQEPNYYWVLVWLAVLTILEIAVVLLGSPERLNIPMVTKVVLLVGMALSKATLVALYFMHLKFERGTLMVIAFTPLVICTFLVFMLLPDLSATPHQTTVKTEQSGTKR
jgi:caa(3)-type oxidase subunit IV